MAWARWLGRTVIFCCTPEQVPYAIERYGKEVNRLYGVLNTRLGKTGAFVAGADYSIADMGDLSLGTYPPAQKIDLTDFPHIERWYKQMFGRPAVLRGIDLLKDRRASTMSDEAPQGAFRADCAKRARRRSQADHHGHSAIARPGSQWRWWLTFLMLATLLASPALVRANPVTVESLSPQGEVRSVQQIALRFSQDMVALGQADAPAPLQIECANAPKPSLRWVDTKRWVAEFKAPLPVGTRCAMRLKKSSLRSLLGAPVAAAGPWAFNTGGPKVNWQQPYPGGRVTEQQVFLLLADAPLARDTLAGALRCKTR